MRRLPRVLTVALCLSPCATGMEPPSNALRDLSSAVPYPNRRIAEPTAIRAKFPSRALRKTDPDEFRRRAREYDALQRAQRKLEMFGLPLPDTDEELLARAREVKFQRGVVVSERHERLHAYERNNRRERFARETNADASSWHVAGELRKVQRLLSLSDVSRERPHLFEGPIGELGIDLRHGEVNRQGELLHKIPKHPTLLLRQERMDDGSSYRRFSIVKAGSTAAISRASYRKRRGATGDDVGQSSSQRLLGEGKSGSASPLTKKQRLDGSTSGRPEASPPQRQRIFDLNERPLDLNEMPPGSPPRSPGHAPSQSQSHPDAPLLNLNALPHHDQHA